MPDRIISLYRFFFFANDYGEKLHFCEQTIIARWECGKLTATLAICSRANTTAEVGAATTYGMRE